MSRGHVRSALLLALVPVVCIAAYGAQPCVPKARVPNQGQVSDPETSSRRELAGERAEGASLALWTDNSLSAMKILVDMEGHSSSELWRQAFQALHAWADCDGDGSLTEQEASLLPRPFALRQIQWGRFLSSPKTPPPWRELDADQSGAVTDTELADYYVHQGLGAPLVAFAVAPHSPQLSTALVNELDLDSQSADAHLDWTEQEWQDAISKLLKRDRNNDESISPGELIAGHTYPGANATRLLVWPNEVTAHLEEMRDLRIMILPADLGDDRWATELIQMLSGDQHLPLARLQESTESLLHADQDQDGFLTSSDLQAWRTAKPDVTVAIHFQADAKQGGILAGRIECDAPQEGSLEITRGEFLTIRSREFEVGFRADPGRLPQLWAATSDDLRRRFEEADAAGDGFVDAEKLAPFPNLTTVRRLLGLADSNGDGKLQTAELADWVSVQDKFVAAQSLVSIMDFGRGLFEFIDVNYDGLLSVPELEQSWPKLKAIGVIGPDGFNAGKLPRQLRLTISPGTPRTNLAGRTSAGPAWLQNMDRNGDGNVSSGEFLGPPSARSASAFAK